MRFENVKNRFLKYVKIDTQSSGETGTHPSTAKQFDLANLLVDELHSLGVQNAFVDEHCYVYASLDANAENLPALGLIAHLDTEPVCSGKNVAPDCVLYQGGEITLKNGKVISPTEFPYLLNYVNQELIVTGGDTLLGADDKAGIAAIVTASIALLMINFSHTDRTTTEARAWLKRIIITWVILNGLGFIMAYVTPFFVGGQWTPTTT